MHTRQFVELGLAVAATVVVFTLAVERESSRAAEPASPVSWQGLVGGGQRSPVSVGQRMIQATANMLAGRFFKSLESEMKAQAKPPAEN